VALEAAAVVLLGALVLAILALVAQIENLRSRITPFLNSTVGQAIARS
jgi:hypothetical protein